MKRAVPVVAAAAISFALLFFAFRNVDFTEVLRILRGTRIEWLPALFALPVFDLWVRAVRWKLLLKPVVKTSAWTLFKLESVGLGLNNLLFLRLGEFARGYFTGIALDIPVWSALSTILVERLCDATALLILFGVGSAWLSDVISQALRRSVLLAVACAVFVLFGVTTIEHALDHFEVWRRLQTRHPRLHRLIEELILGTRALRSPGRAAAVAGLSFTLWLCDACLYWATAQALGFDPALSYLRSVAVLTAAAGACALPAMPGAFGNFEAGVKALLVHFGYSAESSIGYAALIHLVMYAVVTSLGILFLHRFGYSLAGLGRKLGEARAETNRL
ncbi:MAG: flippase-like domain-containing protein [Elusimicrobia bacterium]|nr:flippase-like domain-containing protein [Elusimicrobiota bacterium]